MNEEDRNREIREIQALLLEVQTAARRQMEELEHLKSRLANLADGSKQVEMVVDRGESVAGQGTASKDSGAGYPR